MIQLILCGFVTGLLYYWNYKYCKLSADPAYALQNPIMLRISATVLRIGTTVYLVFLFYMLAWSAVYYLVSLLAGGLAAGAAYKAGKGKGFMHFIGIISWIPWMCLNGMLLYLVMK